MGNTNGTFMGHSGITGNSHGDYTMLYIFIHFYTFLYMFILLIMGIINKQHGRRRCAVLRVQPRVCPRSPIHPSHRVNAPKESG